jgi:hypothetical protein
MTLVFEEEEKPYLLDISSLLYDFELLHDFSLLLCAEEYFEYHFSQYFWYRNGRQIKSYHKLRAARIVKQSPLTIELIMADAVAASGALWILVQIIERISNWKLDRKKLQLEIKKLQKEIEDSTEQRMPETNLEQKTEERGVVWILSSLIGRLESNPTKLVGIELKTERNEDNKEQ